MGVVTDSTERGPRGLLRMVGSKQHVGAHGAHIWIPHRSHNVQCVQWPEQRRFIKVTGAVD